MWRVIAAFMLVLGMLGCGADGAKDTAAPHPSAAAPPTGPAEPGVPTDDTPIRFNGMHGVSPQHQATQSFGPLSPQSATSRSYVVTVSMF